MLLILIQLVSQPPVMEQNLTVIPLRSISQVRYLNRSDFDWVRSNDGSMWHIHVIHKKKTAASIIYIHVYRSFNLPLISFLLFNPHAYSESWIHVVYCRNPNRLYIGITLESKRSDNGSISRITILCDTKFIRTFRQI